MSCPAGDHRFDMDHVCRRCGGVQCEHDTLIGGRCLNTKPCRAHAAARPEWANTDLRVDGTPSDVRRLV